MDHYHEFSAQDSQGAAGSRMGAAAQGTDDRELRQLLQEERDSPTASRPKELDQWFSQVYEYYNEKGLLCLLTTQILQICTITFTWFFSGFIMLCINWTSLWGCSECMSEYVAEDCREQCSGVVQSPGGGALYVLVVSAYLLVLLAYLGYCILAFCKDFKSWAIMQKFFNHDLGISDHELMTIEWSLVTSRLIELQKRFPSRFLKEYHDEHDITSRIMRKDNYLIALFDGPLQGAMHLDHPILNRLMGPRALTHTLEWNIRFCVIEPLFDSEYRVEPRFVGSPHKLQRKFYMAGIVNLALSPFIIMFLLVYFTLKNVQRFHADPRSLSTRSWSLHAKYSFRKYNELPHCFQRRLAKAGPWAEKYCQGFASPLLSIIARFAGFLCSSMLAILIFLWIINEQMMKLDFRFMGINRNLYWYMGICAMGIGMARSFIIQAGNNAESQKNILSCASYTNYLPSRWKKSRLSSASTYKEFTSMYMLNVAVPGYQHSIFLQEMLGVVVTPFILWFVLPDKAHDILSFLRNNTVDKPSVKSICSFSDFSNEGFERHGSEKFGAHPQSASRHNPGSWRGQYREGINGLVSERRRGSLDGKFEKSFVGFMANNPYWRPVGQGHQLLGKLLEQVQQSTERNAQKLMSSFSGVGALARSLREDTATPDFTANATAMFVAGSEFLPTDQVDDMHHAVLRRFKQNGALLGVQQESREDFVDIHREAIAEDEEVEEGDRRPSLGLINDDGRRCDHKGYAPLAQRAAVRHSLQGADRCGRDAELDEQLYNVLLMEFAEKKQPQPERLAQSEQSSAQSPSQEPHSSDQMGPAPGHTAEIYN